jgi:uncharacterized protein (TIGR02145 family)
MIRPSPPLCMFLILLTTMMMAGCFSSVPVRKAPYYLQPPPGGVAINDTLWYDRTEVSNIDWLEYLFWLQLVYGMEDQHYLSALPDTTVWKRIAGWDKNNEYDPEDMTRLYLRHPAYGDFPVVGISQQQALAYSQWRSDRVYEFILLKYGVLVKDWSNLTPENHFTIARFQAGAFKTFNLPDGFLTYPEYRLPKPSEYSMALHYDDSVKASVESKTFVSGRRKCIRTMNAALNHKDFFLPANYYSCYKYHKHRITNLSDNIAEWMSTPGDATEAGSYGKTLKASVPDTFHTDSVNAWTGFRNVMTWKLFLHDSIIGDPVMDIDGNDYKTIRLGDHLWMAENLRTTRLNDGTALDFLPSDVEWAAAKNPAYCWNPDSLHWPEKITGAYYNRYAVGTGKLCPTGWRVPSSQEWESFAFQYGGQMGGALKVTGYSWWRPPNRGATNASGFSAFPSGSRFSAGDFSDPGYEAFWWTTTPYDERFWLSTSISCRRSNFQWMLAEANHGVNVRCVKNTSESQ